MMWFTPKCPVDAETKQWVDEGFRWLMEDLGADTLASVEVILPLEEFFPDEFNTSRGSIRKMVERICTYMDVDASLIDLRFHEKDSTDRLHPLANEEVGETHDLGTYQQRPDGKYRISIETSQAANPEMLAATIAHELGHVILAGEQRLPPDDPNHEPLTDLVTVFYGMGIFNANSCMVFEQWTNSQFQGWQAGGAGYLTEEAFGYALALFAYVCGDEKAGWSTHLRTNVRHYFKKSLKYLVKTADTPVTRLQTNGQ